MLFSCLCCCHSSKKSLFHLYQQPKSPKSKVKFSQASNRCKRVLEASKLAYANKIKESITSQELGSCDFWHIANSAHSKGRPAIPPLFNGSKVLPSASDKAKFFLKNLSKNSNLDDSGISLLVFFCWTNLKLHNISVNPKMIKKTITNLNSSKVSDPDFHPVVVLKNCEPELTYILAEFCFRDCWKVLVVVPENKNVGERCTAVVLLVFFL